MSDTASLRKQLRIKTGVAKRLHKELLSYQKEKEDLTIRLGKLQQSDPKNPRDEGERDIKNQDDDGEIDNSEWALKNQKDLIIETEKMVNQSTTQLATAGQELRELVMLAEKEVELADDEEYHKAKEALELISV